MTAPSELTLEISCERPIRSTLVSFISLFGGTPQALRSSWSLVVVARRRSSPACLLDLQATDCVQSPYALLIFPRTASTTVRPDGSTPKAAHAPPSTTVSPSMSTLNWPYGPPTSSTSALSSRRSRAATRTACSLVTQYAHERTWIRAMRPSSVKRSRLCSLCYPGSVPPCRVRRTAGLTRWRASVAPAPVGCRPCWAGDLIVVLSFLQSVVGGGRRPTPVPGRHRCRIRSCHDPRRYGPCPCRPSSVDRVSVELPFVKPNIRSASAARDVRGQ